MRRVSVELTRPDEASYVGSAEGPPSDSELDLSRAGAEAAAQAVVSAVGAEGAAVKVEALERVKLFGRDIVIVSVVATYRGQSYSLFGVAPIQKETRPRPGRWRFSARRTGCSSCPETGLPSVPAASAPMNQVIQRQPGERVRFYGAQRIPLAGSKCRIRVRRDLASGGTYVGAAEGPTGLDHELRSAGEATVEALRQVVKAKAIPVTLELTEVASFVAFGKPGVTVSLEATFQNVARSLLGFSSLEKDSARSVAVAVLSATNRLLGLASQGP